MNTRSRRQTAGTQDARFTGGGGAAYRCLHVLCPPTGFGVGSVEWVKLIKIFPVYVKLLYKIIIKSVEIKFVTIELHYSTHYLNPADNMFGGKTQNGTWTGVLGMLQRGEAEVSNVAFVMSSVRMEAVDFTIPLLEIR